METDRAEGTSARTQQGSRVALLNTAILTNTGQYLYYEAHPASVREYLRLIEESGGVVESYVGHQATAEALSAVLRRDVSVNRGEYRQQSGEYALVFSLNRRLTEPRELTLTEVEEIGFTLGWLHRIG